MGKKRSADGKGLMPLRFSMVSNVWKAPNGGAVKERFHQYGGGGAEPLRRYVCLKKAVKFPKESGGAEMLKELQALKERIKILEIVTQKNAEDIEEIKKEIKVLGAQNSYESGREGESQGSAGG